MTKHGLAAVIAVGFIARSAPAETPSPEPAALRGTRRGAPAITPVTDPPAAAVSPPSTVDSPEPATIEVRGTSWGSPRGAGEFLVQREWLQASPRQQTSEMLSVAPGFFVDHEDGEGFGNDVYLRGFDLEHGSGIEMRLGTIPVNIPTHIQGQGYADVNFIIPEVVRSLRVQEGPYDPRQGDAAIVGSAIFDLGVPERGYQVKASYGSFAQKRLVGIVAPEGADPDTFAAFSLRQTDGFGQNRGGRSGSLNAQYGVDLSARDRLKVVGTGYGAFNHAPGVVRQDDVDAGRIGFYDEYANFGQGQSVKAERVLLGAEYTHTIDGGARVLVAPWAMYTDFRARQNYSGSLQSSVTNPADSGLGDLFETRNREAAAGLTASYRPATMNLGRDVELVAEPGAYLRYGGTSQSKSLLVPETLQRWDRRLDVGLRTLDVGAYVDLDFRLWKRLRISGGPRVDALSVGIDDQLANVVPVGFPPPAMPRPENRNASGVSIGPRLSAEFAVDDLLSVIGSYGEGYRSLDATRMRDGATPYSKVRSVEGGLRAHDARHRYSTTLSVFQTWIGNELVFVAEQGGLETQNASTRRGVVASFIARPLRWLLGSSALSVTTAEYSTLVPGISHYVPNVPPVLLHVELNAHGPLFELGDRTVTGRAGVGYTLMSGKHLSDSVIGPVTHALNVGGQLRRGMVEVGLEIYNALGLEYADDAELFVSNYSVVPGQQLASRAVHYVAAPPRAAIGSLTLYF